MNFKRVFTLAFEKLKLTKMHMEKNLIEFSSSFTGRLRFEFEDLLFIWIVD